MRAKHRRRYTVGTARRRAHFTLPELLAMTKRQLERKHAAAVAAANAAHESYQFAVAQLRGAHMASDADVRAARAVWNAATDAADEAYGELLAAGGR